MAKKTTERPPHPRIAPEPPDRGSRKPPTFDPSHPDQLRRGPGELPVQLLRTLRIAVRFIYRTAYSLSAPGRGPG